MIALLEERDAQLLAEAEAEIERWLDQIRGDREAIATELEQAVSEARRLRSAAVTESEAMLRTARDQARRLLEAAISEADHLVSGGEASHGD